MTYGVSPQHGRKGAQSTIRAEQTGHCCTACFLSPEGRSSSGMLSGAYGEINDDDRYEYEWQRLTVTGHWLGGVVESDVPSRHSQSRSMLFGPSNSSGRLSDTYRAHHACAVAGSQTAKLEKCRGCGVAECVRNAFRMAHCRIRVAWPLEWENSLICAGEGQTETHTTCSAGRAWEEDDLDSDLDSDSDSRTLTPWLPSISTRASSNSSGNSSSTRPSYARYARRQRRSSCASQMSSTLAPQLPSSATSMGEPCCCPSG